MPVGDVQLYGGELNQTYFLCSGATKILCGENALCLQARGEGFACALPWYGLA